MIFLTIAIIIISWYLNAIIDAIDFGKPNRGENMFELWHILKWFSYVLPYGLILYLIHSPLWLYIGLLLFSYTRNLIYNYARYKEIYKYDNELIFPSWIRKIFGISR